MKRELDIVILSDVHLGTYGCHAKELLTYLHSIKVKTLILNGDFIDMWQFRKRYFPKDHMQVLQCVLKMASEGTKVYYITGNHDDALRRYSDFSAGNIHLRDQLVLQLKGRSYWIFHGDIFDIFTKYSPFLSNLGGKSYDYLIWLNRLTNNVRMALGMPKMSLAKKVKNKMKKALQYINDFEDTAIKIAAEQEYDYVICGHIHRPQMKSSEYKGRKTTYLNSGDWVENLTALEYKWGRWSIYEYDELDYDLDGTPGPSKKDDQEESLLMNGISAREVFKQIVQEKIHKEYLSQ